MGNICVFLYFYAHFWERYQLYFYLFLNPEDPTKLQRFFFSKEYFYLHFCYPCLQSKGLNIGIRRTVKADKKMRAEQKKISYHYEYWKKMYKK